MTVVHNEWCGLIVRSLSAQPTTAKNNKDSP